MKKLIINADDFGASEQNNKAIKLGYEAGIITSTSIMTNMPAFDNTIETLEKIKDIDLGFHFNIIEGPSLTKSSLLCNQDGYFNCSFQELIIKSQNKECILQIEKEFRVQIERILPIHPITHIDSHIHTHSIPPIFKLIIKLAQEYNIKFVRTQKEKPYIVWDKAFNSKLPVNILKNILLNIYTSINIKAIKTSNIKTNDYFIGAMYTGNMTRETFLQGLKKIKKDETITEIIFHPYFDENKDGSKYNNYKEFLITQNPKFKEELESLGFVLSKYLHLV